jgi:hypothetical protein
MAANVGGTVERTVKTFDVDVPAVESYLREYADLPKANLYWHRQIVAVEILLSETAAAEEIQAGDTKGER